MSHCGFATVGWYVVVLTPGSGLDLFHHPASLFPRNSRGILSAELWTVFCPFISIWDHHEKRGKIRKRNSNQSSFSIGTWTCKFNSEYICETIKRDTCWINSARLNLSPLSRPHAGLHVCLPFVSLLCASLCCRCRMITYSVPGSRISMGFISPAQHGSGRLPISTKTWGYSRINVDQRRSSEGRGQEMKMHLSWRERRGWLCHWQACMHTFQCGRERELLIVICPFHWYQANTLISCFSLTALSVWLIY